MIFSSVAHPDIVLVETPHITYYDWIAGQPDKRRYYYCIYLRIYIYIYKHVDPNSKYVKTSQTDIIQGS